MARLAGWGGWGMSKTPPLYTPPQPYDYPSLPTHLPLSLPKLTEVSENMGREGTETHRQRGRKLPLLLQKFATIGPRARGRGAGGGGATEPLVAPRISQLARPAPSHPQYLAASTALTSNTIPDSKPHSLQPYPYPTHTPPRPSKRKKAASVFFCCPQSERLAPKRLKQEICIRYLVSNARAFQHD